MKIKTKLLLGFAIMLLLMIALTGIGINRLFHDSAAMDEIYQNRYMKVNMANSISRNVTSAARSLLNLVLNASDLEKDKEIANANRALDTAGKEFTNLYKVSPDAAENQLMKELIEIGKKYIDYKEQIIKFSLNNQIDEAVALRKSIGITTQISLENKLDELVAAQEQGINEAYTTSSKMNSMAIRFLVILLLCGLLLGIAIMTWIIYSISNGLNSVIKVLSKYSNGDFDSRIVIISKDEIGEVAKAFNIMAEEIEKKRAQELENNQSNVEQAWLKSNVAQMTTMLQSAKDINTVAQMFMSEVAAMIGIKCGCFYLNELQGNEMVLNIYGSYAYKPLDQIIKTIHYGEGLVGQCALDQNAILLKEIPKNYLHVHSSLGSADPANLLIYPVIFEDKLVAVIELAALYELTSLQFTLLDQLTGALSITITSIQGRNRVEELLRISQALTEELQAQSEELLAQQIDLKDSNKLLEAQILQTEQINKQIEKTKSILEQQTLQLASASNYKSEFLANMSHELRTPLNSMLILSQLLAENKEGNLTTKQIDFAQTVHSSGSDLIRLIDEILDLSKVEAGKIEITPEIMQLNELQKDIKRKFMMVAKKKELSFEIYLDDTLPPTMYTDSYRVEQILNNLLSNAFKFTEQGHVHLHISQIEQPAKFITFAVSDTGIGIAEEKLQLIFEAFQQENGTTSRKYGGTGLGLSISRELARILGGKIEISSQKGIGSTFTLYLPDNYSEIQKTKPIIKTDLEISPAKEKLVELSKEIIDNRSTWESNRFDGLKILLVDDDIRNIFALSSVLENYNMKVTFAENGRQALEITRQQSDFDLILMDIMMPEMDGYETIKLLRAQPQLEQIPIIALTANAMNVDRDLSILAGATDFISKPIHIEQLLLLMSEKLS